MGDIAASLLQVDELADDTIEGVRRKHTLQDDGRIIDGIERERALLSDLRGESDLVIDTSDMNVHQLRMQILTIPEHDINIALGSDYTGECKKGFLLQGMFRADQRGMLGLHAGSKVVRARDPRTGKLKTFGVLMFGLTATGKSTWST